MVTTTRTFLIKIKSHRDESLNKRVDDLSEVGRTLEKEGHQGKTRNSPDVLKWSVRCCNDLEDLPVVRMDDTLVYSYFDRTSHQWKKDIWSKTIRNTVRRGEWEYLMVHTERGIFLFVCDDGSTSG